MHGRVGYEYHYDLSMVDKDEIKSLLRVLDDMPNAIKSYLPKNGNISDGATTFVFEIRTNFVSRRRSDEAVMIDSESYGVLVSPSRGSWRLNILARFRMRDYWMSVFEVDVLSGEALAFAEEMARRHAPLNLIPVVVHLEVCTVQQEGESWDATMDRAICNRRLVPLHLCPYQLIVERKPMTRVLMNFLSLIERIRVGDGDGDEVIKDDVCAICLCRAGYGAQISVLECDHAFHSHCILRWLEGNNLCPLCRSPVYHPCLRYGRPYR